MSTKQPLEWQAMILQSGIVGGVATAMHVLGISNVLASFIGPLTGMTPAVISSITMFVTVSLSEIVATIITTQF